MKTKTLNKTKKKVVPGVLSGVWRHLLATTVVTRLPASVSGHSLRSGLGSVRRSLLRRLRSVALQQGTNFFCVSSDSSQISAAETDAACRLHLSYYWGSCLWVTRSRLSPRKKKEKKKRSHSSLPLPATSNERSPGSGVCDGSSQQGLLSLGSAAAACSDRIIYLSLGFGGWTKLNEEVLAGTYLLFFL